jgi:UDP-3-O-[3-hydroxymyristoyl] N-acetylglucosamine deacetylase/3-hydroxyacyl-[acyl-carrier-protein] dehydratase
LKTAQTTIEKPIDVQGRGLHTGVKVTMRLAPSGPDTGITFLRTDLPGRPTIPAHIKAIQSLQARHTVLGEGEAKVQTVEHVLAACIGLGVDNVLIELDGEEAPGIDGSAAPFVGLLRTVGTVTLEAKRRPLRVRRAVHLDTANGSISALPNPGGGLTVSYSLAYDNPRLRRQDFTFRLDREDFASQIAPARTFCLEEEVEPLRKAGFGKGADLSNTLVVGREGEIIGNELRFPNEFVRHKVLDLLGDLCLAGRPLEAHIVASRTGHAANHGLVRRILEDCGEEGKRDGVLVPEIQRILPHRYPFLLVDRIETLEGDQRAVGWKMVTGTEEFFQGHFPGKPIMPGVLQVEAMAQVAGALLLRQRQYEGKLSVILSIDGVRFRRTVSPGDRLRIVAEVEKVRKRTAQMWVTAGVEGDRVSEARFRFMLMDDEED